MKELAALSLFSVKSFVELNHNPLNVHEVSGHRLDPGICRGEVASLAKGH